MTAHAPQTVRHLSIRVALAATGLVALVYLAVAVGVLGIVTRNLTDQLDRRLSDSLDFQGRGPGPGGPDEQGPGHPFGTPIISWAISDEGTVTPGTTGVSLPASLEHVSGPETATIGGVQVRLMGRQVGDHYVVVGQTLESVTQAQSTLLIAELLIAPVLLLVVFFGAVAIGRRVATPIETSRQRQLEFTADASHELRTPLAVIEAHTSLALAQDRPAAWYRNAFERVEVESRRMRRLLDDLLWLARFDATQGQPHAEPVDLGVLASQTADRFAAVAEARHLTLHVETAANAVVTAPPEWLDRLLGVLLDNACKYSPDGGSVGLEVVPDRGRISVVVDDSGPGIPEAERPRIFDRFHRASDQPGGAGLGLAIADAIVRATNGQWRVGSSPGGGARMSVSWQRTFEGPRERVAARPGGQVAAD